MTVPLYQQALLMYSIYDLLDFSIYISTIAVLPGAPIPPASVGRFPKALSLFEWDHLPQHVLMGW